MFFMTLCRLFCMSVAMGCVSPILVRTPTGVVMAPCGRCMSCCIARQSALEFVAKKELQETYKKGLGASFLTLTYSDTFVPYVAPNLPYMTLVKKDFQDFLKRLRYYVSKNNFSNVKFIGCGEYGKLGRPHYHLVLFGLSDALADSFTASSWSYGLRNVGSLQSGGLRYVLKYMTKSRQDREIEKFYDSVGVQRPFIHHSQKFGFNWLFNHAQEIVDNDFTFFDRGVVRLYPKNVRKFVESVTGVSSRPAVEKYMSTINTRGESLDDFFARRVYDNERELVNKSIQDHSAASFPSSCRRSRELRSVPSWSVSSSDCL